MGSDSANIALDTPIRQCVFVAFDTETTGLNPVIGRLVELSGVKFTGAGQELSVFQALIDPEVAIPDASTAVHGITDAMVLGKPTFETVVPEFISWALQREAQDRSGPNQENILVAHNAPFDLGFLEVALGKLNYPVPDNLVIDTLPLARALLTDSQNHQLKTLVEYFGVGTDSYHRALDDSYHLKNIFLKLAARLNADATLRDLLAIAGKLRFLERETNNNAEERWQSRNEYLTIQKAIDSRQSLRIQYSGTKVSDRVVTPHSVLFTRGVPYLTAFCHQADAERTFRIDRMISIELVSAKLTHKPGANASAE